MKYSASNYSVWQYSVPKKDRSCPGLLLDWFFFWGGGGVSYKHCWFRKIKKEYVRKYIHVKYVCIGENCQVTNTVGSEKQTKENVSTV